MGISRSPKPPPAPKASEIAKTQLDYNIKTGQASQVGSAVSQNNPFGSLGYTYGIGPNGIMTLTANQTLSPEQQLLFNLFQGTQRTAGSDANTLLEGANYGEAPDLSTATDSIVNQNLERYKTYLDPFFTRDTENLDNQLRNQGLVPGTQAYNRAMNQLRQDQGQTVAGYIANMQPTAYNQAVSTYKLPADIATSLARFAAPGSIKDNLVDTPIASYGGVDFGGITNQAYDAAMKAYQAKLNSQGNILGLIGGVAGAALGGPIGSSLGSGIGNLFRG